MPSVTVTADLSKIGAFAKTLDKKAASVLRREVRAAVNEVGKDALERAKSYSRWSTGRTSTPPKKTRNPQAVGNAHQSIPSSLSLKTSFAQRSASVTMKTDAKKAPHAYLYERGSKNGGGKGIRHPLFGDKDHWYTNRTRPYFYKAVWQHTDEIKKRMNEAIIAAVRELGYEI